jgi:predicted nucleic acid-binding protein/plasmid stability protein
MMQHGSESWMTTLTIRNVDAALKEELRVRAARHGRSLRHILREALSGEKRRAEPNLAEAIRRRFPAAGRSRRAGTAPARAGARSAAVRSVIVLDTNVLSELIRSEPAAAVFAWVSAQPRATLYTTSVSKAEILYGIAALPKGRRRLALAAAAEAMFPDDFEGRVLPFDETAAVHYADIVAGRRREGRPIEAFDAQIAATARVAGAGLATREAGGFEGAFGLRLINPWAVP